MRDPNVFEVTSTEHHHLPTCPCVRCVVERERRSGPANDHVRNLSVDAAHILGFISKRCPAGSLARQLAERQ